MFISFIEYRLCDNIVSENDSKWFYQIIADSISEEVQYNNIVSNNLYQFIFSFNL